MSAANLEQLVYVSTSAVPLRSIMDVSDILEESARHNPANNITGALAFTQTRFVQLLEGSAGSIDVLLLRLMIDPRHADLVVIDRIPVETRSFPDWHMISPLFTPSGQARLDVLVANEMLPIEAFRLLLLEMIAEQALPAIAPRRRRRT
ncbi:BLUF domain-containing protein [Brevundimonas subvibrioides]|uniref:BLUF domain protein n=1 Tax=Brevundimonas subvibrioides (strain ATCC 15264 / DSM 4735 / LMG 14903 / NBRC 16000 / CB 81) TaxID=633149 RepID=D9QF25_BRESC|nr:BLUF domain-containing protein [Brevundimonas subvibrioides]ADL00510.1 BLUF domain protein [Brevundimonas subvibrioides ATCC 15264]